MRNFLTENGRDHGRCAAAIVGAYFFNIIKRLDDDQLVRLAASLDDLNRAAAEARAEADSP